MKKTGFTLTEALLAIAIIGVVSALTLPSVTLEHRKSTFGASLAAAVSDFETAMSTMIIRDGAYDLLETRAWRYVRKDLSGKFNCQNSKEEVEKFNDYVKFFSIPLGGKLGDYYPDGIIYAFNKTQLNVDSFSEVTPLEMKNGILYGLYINKNEHKNKGEYNMLNQGTNLYAIAAEVWIDVNGATKPNTVGRDIFYFILGADGKLYPYGGKDLEIYGAPSWGDDYGFKKTNELIENNYKMNY